ncbi:hypothetical protein PG985_000048 [Apiospora marii]|uniref:Heterokaryon incompatibility domain-containing protein n=1 Tax=Apiospora marii TaxID=335849 RepID=A0ABR1R0F5_9PEZI
MVVGDLTHFSNSYIAVDARGPHDDTLQDALYPRTIAPNAIDMHQIGNMISDCSSTHDGCREDRTQMVGLKVIDCITNRVVVAPPNCRYFALSYVWGSSKKKGTTKFPKVVQDSISVTRALGSRYIWVDRYCIDQDATHNQHIFNQMHRIYSGAFVTIIAAAGSDAEYGLPGVSTPGQRRPEFPSWSWVGWAGEVQWHDGDLQPRFNWGFLSDSLEEISRESLLNLDYRGADHPRCLVIFTKLCRVTPVFKQIGKNKSNAPVLFPFEDGYIGVPCFWDERPLPKGEYYAADLGQYGPRVEGSARRHFERQMLLRKTDQQFERVGLLDQVSVGSYSPITRRGLYQRVHKYNAKSVYLGEEEVTELYGQVGDQLRWLFEGTIWSSILNTLGYTETQATELPIHRTSPSSSPHPRALRQRSAAKLPSAHPFEVSKEGRQKEILDFAFNQAMVEYVTINGFDQECWHHGGIYADVSLIPDFQLVGAEGMGSHWLLGHVE